MSSTLNAPSTDSAGKPPAAELPEPDVLVISHNYDLIDTTPSKEDVQQLTLGWDWEIWHKSKTLPFIRLRDKITFSLGVANFGLIAFFAGGYQWLLPYYYSLKFPFLIFARFYEYKKQSWHYFLLDFCYYGNALLLINLWLVPHNARLFQVVFAVSNGPLLWAVLIFRNSLVFHSIDKITSCFIHISPASISVVTYGARWFLADNSIKPIDVCIDSECSIDWRYLYGYPVLFFAGHQFVYYILVHIILRRSIEVNPDALTIYRYTVQSNKKSALYRFLSLCGGSFRRVMFSFWYSVFAAVTMLPPLLLYYNYWAHLVFLALMIAWAIWNGANFYIEVFSRKYEGAQQSQPACTVLPSSSTKS